MERGGSQGLRTKPFNPSFRNSVCAPPTVIQKVKIKPEKKKKKLLISDQMRHFPPRTSVQVHVAMSKPPPSQLSRQPASHQFSTTLAGKTSTQVGTCHQGRLCAGSPTAGIPKAAVIPSADCAPAPQELPSRCRSTLHLLWERLWLPWSWGKA